jgi:LacI family transcriptional regulator
VASSIRRSGRFKPSATLKDVALAAGVTPMTVSNVLNQRAGQVGPQTREKVLAAVERLGYRPHAVARRLRSRRNSAVGMLILDDVPEFLNDPFTTQVVAGLSNLAADSGYSLVLQGVRSNALENVPLLAQIETDGVCALLSGSSYRRRALVERLVTLHLPVVLVQENISAEGVCNIRQDDRGGAVQVAQHVLSRGARHLVMLLPDEEWPAMIEREIGVRLTCDAAAARLDILRCGDESIADTHAALTGAFSQRTIPDAIIGGNDRMALAALKWLADRSISVPGQVKVTGFNGFDFAAYATPSLTTVRSVAYEMGRRAGQEMLASFETGIFSSEEIVLPVQFIAAASS